MARIAGVNIDDNLKLDYALTNIKGIGWSRSKEILSILKMDDALRVSDLSTDDINKIATELAKYEIEGDLIRKQRENVQRLRAIGSYRGIRHARGLPSRGQRTKSNARTKRGKRKTVGAFKKDALSKMGSTSKGDKE
jgi:small subunit ribosomal protein S13